MAPFNPANKHHLSLQSLVAMSTLMSPTHSPSQLVQAGGGIPTAEIPSHRPYLSHSIQDHLKRVYDKLRGGDATLSREHLEQFMAATQGQPVSLAEKPHYKFEEFLEVVWYNQGLTALKKPEIWERDLTKPISNYFISSSHNTYLSGNQLSSKSSTEAYRNVLIRGCRCIEIDVWNGEPQTPGHRPHLSASLSSQAASAATAAVKEAKETLMHAKNLLKERGGGHHHHHFHLHKVPSINTEAIAHEDVISGSAIDSSGGFAEPGEKSRNSSRSSSFTGAPKSEPRVLHGWTLTPDVGFRDVCKTIRETAFLKSNLPIIVSLEVHADLDQQEVMVDIMKEEWKGYLVDEAFPACDPAKRLPRLEELLNKILVKVKKATSTPLRTPGSAATGALELATPSSSSLAPAKSHDPGDSASGSEDERVSKSSKKPKKSKICDSLSRLGVYTHSAHFSSFSQEEAKSPPHVFSICEREIVELHGTVQTELFAHNRDFFMRAYPSGRRIDSSNPDPSLFWRRGVQMVALNWQSWDEGTMLNEGMFAGTSGWVLKPPAYRSAEATEAPAIRRMILDFKLTILAGQHIPLPLNHGVDESFYPYVKCELHVDRAEGQQVDAAGWSKEGKYKQVSRYRKGDHPDFGLEGEVLSFVGVPNVIQELSFVRIKIEDEKYAKDRLAAWACIRLDRLQPGYRLIKLLDGKGLPTNGLLLVKIEKVLR